MNLILDSVYDYENNNKKNKDYTDIALICENGHIVNDSVKTYPEDNSEFCQECGAKNISNCPSCGKLIDGKRHTEDCIAFDSIELPKYCKHCGQAYPWTKAKIEAVEEIVDLMDELNEDEKQQLKETTAMIATDNPKTTVGVLKIKKYLGKVGETLGNTAQKVFVDLASETAVKIMKEQGMI